MSAKAVDIRVIGFEANLRYKDMFVCSVEGTTQLWKSQFVTFKALRECVGDKLILDVMNWKVLDEFFLNTLCIREYVQQVV